MVFPQSKKLQEQVSFTTVISNCSAECECWHLWAILTPEVNIPTHIPTLLKQIKWPIPTRRGCYNKCIYTFTSVGYRIKHIISAEFVSSTYFFHMVYGNVLSAIFIWGGGGVLLGCSSDQHKILNLASKEFADKNKFDWPKLLHTNKMFDHCMYGLKELHLLNAKSNYTNFTTLCHP